MASKASVKIPQLRSHTKAPYPYEKKIMDYISAYDEFNKRMEVSRMNRIRQDLPQQTTLKGLKRRRSAFYNDFKIEFMRPIRRTRLKSNLSYSSLNVPESQNPLTGEQNITHTDKDRTEDVPGLSVNFATSQTNKMISKILQELDKVDSTREKSPSKLSPSMLRDTPPQSLQSVKEPKFSDNLREKKENSSGSSYEKQEKSKESETKEILSEMIGGDIDDHSAASTSKVTQETDKSSISPSKLNSEEKVIPLEETKKADVVLPNIVSSPAATELNRNIDHFTEINLEKPSSSAFGVSETSENPTIPFNTHASEVPCTVQSQAASRTASSVFGNLPANTTNDNNSCNNSQSTSAFALSSTSPLKFEEPAAPFPTATVSRSSGQITKETEANNSTFGNFNTFKFGGVASEDMSSGDVFGAKTSEIKSTPGVVFGYSSPAVADAGNKSLIFGVTSSSTPQTDINKFSWNSAAATTSSSSSSIFGFNDVSSASAGSSQSEASNPFSATNAPFMFTSASAGSSQSGASNPFGDANAPFMFTSSRSAPSSSSSGNTSSSSPFGRNWQAPNSAPVFSSSFTTSSSSSAFSCRVSTSAAAGATASNSIFGASTNIPPSSPTPFDFISTASTTPQNKVFDNSTHGFPVSATTPPPYQEVIMEDVVSEDTYQPNNTSMVQPMFGQQSFSIPQPNFAFNQAPVTLPPSMDSPFQFGGQTIVNTSQNASPFEVQDCGGFSLGNGGGGDKSGRRIFKPKKTNRRK